MLGNEITRFSGFALVLLMVVWLGVACSEEGSSESPAVSATARPEIATTTTATSTAVPSRCVPVSTVFVAELTSSLTVTGGGSLRAAHAVRSEDFENVWFIAAEIDGPGMDGTGDIAIWATNIEPSSTAPSGSVFAVGGFATEFSVWPEGDGFSQFDDGAGEARDCVRSEVG